jgi:hypothetical protein
VWATDVVADEVILLGGRGQAGGGGAGTGMDEGFSQGTPTSGMRSAPRGRPAATPKAAASVNDGITDDDVPFSPAIRLMMPLVERNPMDWTAIICGFVAVVAMLVAVSTITSAQDANWGSRIIALVILIVFVGIIIGIKMLIAWAAT